MNRSTNKKHLDNPPHEDKPPDHAPPNPGFFWVNVCIFVSLNIINDEEAQGLKSVR